MVPAGALGAWASQSEQVTRESPALSGFWQLETGTQLSSSKGSREIQPPEVNLIQVGLGLAWVVSDKNLKPILAT